MSARGCWITDASGRRFLDAAGGAIVTGIGHGRAEIAEVIAEQMRKVEFVHASVFTTDALETYCDSVASLVPMSGAKVYPVAGGSEATETALKMARAYQLARGREQRTRVLAREGSYHGNSLGALDLSGRPALRRPYEPWLGRFAQVPGIDDPDVLEQAITARDDVAAVMLEPISGASRAGAVPHPDYWSEVAEICRRHDVLLVADEVMTGFGRTGKWFGVEHWGVSPDLMTTGKGASSGYWPLGHVIASGSVFDTIRATFVHGFTFSHHPVGAAVGQAVLDIIRRESLVEAARAQGEKLRTALEAITSDRIVEIRGKGLLLGVILIGDRDGVVRAAREEGLLVYPAAIEAVVLGPPLTIDDREIDQIADRLRRAIAR
ncbi:MAG: aspartate aminotransferase family protein [Acidimicrobiia bacterium]